MYCQFNEEEIIERIFKEIGTKNKIAVEIGCLPDYKFSNIKKLMDEGWGGVLFDKEKRTGVIQALVTKNNINDLLKEAKVPKDLDLLSIDIDSNDYYLFEALEYEPRLLIIEYNPHLQGSTIMKYDESFNWTGGWTYGASEQALLTLAEKKGYKLADKNSDNLFFIKT